MKNLMKLQLEALTGGTLHFSQVQSIAIQDKVHGSFSCYPFHIPCIVHLTTALLRIASPQGTRTFQLEKGCLLIPSANKVHITATVLHDTTVLHNT